MYRISYEMIINGIENDDTRKLIGNIDTDAISKNNVQSLFYEFPLIERIVLEIYKLLPLSDVEYYQQGTMRTILEILNKDSHNYFPSNLIDILQKYYKENGLRNRLLHVKDDVGIVKIMKDEVDYEELKFAIMQLISILRNTCNKYTIEKIGTIEMIK